ncbi:hypothetical protein FCS83_06815 [Oenococcus sp. UCMA 17063]|nr:hypothetical protein [Oenococcus sp. UCMA 17063]
MKGNRKKDAVLFLIFLLFETFFVYSVFTKDETRSSLLKVQTVLSQGVDVFVLSTIISVIFTCIFFLFQYAIGRLLVRMFSSDEPNFFYYILPRDIALMINILLFLSIGTNHQIMFSSVVFLSAFFTSFLFYKNTRSLIQSFIFAMPIYIDTLVSILMVLK